MKTCMYVLAMLLAGICTSAQAQTERILDFHSDITIADDAAMQVTETIRVHAEGDQIRHGIYRDFPTDYRDGTGNRVHVDFEPMALTRDGSGEPFHTEQKGNGVRVYFGDANTLLESGDYTYAFDYRTTRQLGFFADHDELYWNVTGNGWAFPIAAASAAITLPDDIATDRIKVEGYTGPQGSKARNYTATVEAPSHATIQTTTELPPENGLTVVVSFPKGIVASPTDAQRAHWFLRDNAGVLVGGIGLLLLLGYYYLAWLKVGRDPRAGVIFPQYVAPEGVTPGAMRHVERMRYDNRCVAADIVDLAVRGTLTIHQTGKEYSLHRASSGRATLLPVESALLHDLLGGKSELALQQTEHVRIGKALQNHRSALKGNDIGRYFHTNTRQVVIGVILSVITLVASVLVGGSGGQLAGAAFMLVWLSGWSVGVWFLVRGAITAWRSASGGFGYAGAIFISLFALPFLIGEVVGLGAFAAIAGLAYTIVAVALVVTNLAFFQWMKAPTVDGRKLLDQIAGLRLYLGVAERDELARQQAPAMTVDEFQHFLPYALALGVEKTWGDRFAEALGPAAVAAAAGAMAWYQGGGMNNIANIGNFSSGLGSSLSGAISSSSTAPGSSSGSSGGGSSGGGGGGGGGGGW